MKSIDDEIRSYWSYADAIEGELLSDIAEKFQYISDDVQDILNRFQKIELSGMLSSKEVNVLQRKIKQWKESGYTDSYDMKLYIRDLERRIHIKAEEALFLWLFAAMIGGYKSVSAVATKSYLKIAQHVYKREFKIAQKITNIGGPKLPQSISKLLLETQPDGNSFYKGIYADAEYRAKKLAKMIASQKQKDIPLNIDNPNFEKALKIQKNWMLRPSTPSRSQPNNYAGYIDNTMAFIVGYTVAQAFQDAGVKKYQFIATIDGRTTEACRSLHLKIFNMSALKLGENAPPIYPPPHPCRSIIRAIN